MDADLAKEINTKTDTESDKQKGHGLAKSSKDMNTTQKSRDPISDQSIQPCKEAAGNACAETVKMQGISRAVSS